MTHIKHSLKRVASKTVERQIGRAANHEVCTDRQSLHKHIVQQLKTGLSISRIARQCQTAHVVHYPRGRVIILCVARHDAYKQ